jgi:hypothetical protein
VAKFRQKAKYKWGLRKSRGGKKGFTIHFSPTCHWTETRLRCIAPRVPYSSRSLATSSCLGMRQDWGLALRCDTRIVRSELHHQPSNPERLFLSSFIYFIATSFSTNLDSIARSCKFNSGFVYFPCPMGPLQFWDLHDQDLIQKRAVFIRVFSIATRVGRAEMWF